MQTGKMRLAAALAAWLVLCGCAAESDRRAARVDAAEPAITDDMHESAPRRDSMPAVMQAKLAHSQAVLEGLATSNFRQIELNAGDLQEISQRADWIVQDSPAYYSLSDEFRKVAGDLVLHARRQDLKAVTDDYARLTHSCIACHTYLRNERVTKDMGGKLSLLRPAAAPPLAP